MNRRLIDEPRRGVGTETEDDQEFTLTVTWGAEKFAPIQYHSFDVGPLSLTVSNEPGLTPVQLHARALAHLKEMAEAQFAEQLAGFLDRAKRAAAAVRK
jgi:hypothetical protein